MSETSACSPAAITLFRNYTEMPRVVPPAARALLRFATFGVTVALIAALLLQGDLGLTPFGV